MPCSPGTSPRHRRPRRRLSRWHPPEAAVLLRLKQTDQKTMIARVKALVPAIQNAGAALLLEAEAAAAAAASVSAAEPAEPQSE